jgi:hypothetical protein
VLPYQVVEVDVDLFDLADLHIAGMKAVGDEHLVGDGGSCLRREPNPQVPVSQECEPLVESTDGV